MSSEILERLHQHKKSEPIVGYFGYGSLVNEDTLRTEYLASIPARLSGWHRSWDIPFDHEFGNFSTSLLTARPSSGRRIRGAVVFDSAKNLPEVDEREANYRRHNVNWEDLGLNPAFAELDCQFFVYEAEKNERKISQTPPILQSYLDAVLQGFYRLYGEEGVIEFVNETHNFSTPIFTDRNDPKYPRSVKLTPQERDLIDFILSQHADITFIS